MTDTKYFLAIDPASSTGYARFSLADGAITLNNYGIIEVKNIANEEFSTVGDTCNDLHDKIQELLDPIPEVVYIEDFFVSRKCVRGVNLNFYLRASIAMLLSRNQIKYKFLSPSEWKAHITGIRGGRPTKTMKTANSNANKTIITDKLQERYSIKFPEKILINGKPRKFKFDISDAVGIGIYGIHTNFPSARFSSPSSTTP
tara:strand:- start:1856 stop:2458 length:603 start_codon:yes stop_codon:yes gene_type:complete